jgi:hypothetical protein
VRGHWKSRGSRTAAPSDTLPTQAASLSTASANRATGVRSPDTRDRRVLIDRPEGRHARVACAANTTSGERGALGDAGADQVLWVTPDYPREPNVAARSSSAPPAMERVGLKCEPPTPLTGTKGRGALGYDYILRSACRRVRISWRETSRRNITKELGCLVRDTQLRPRVSCGWMAGPRTPPLRHQRSPAARDCA